MTIEQFTDRRIYRAPVDEGSAGGAGAASTGDSPQGGDAAGADPARGVEPSGTGIQRPDWMPQKLWGDGSQFASDDGSLNHEAMATSIADAYKNAERSLFKRRDDLKKEIESEMKTSRPEGLPAAPGDYVLNPPEGLPEGVELEWRSDDDPLVHAAREMAYKYKMDQREFDGLVEAFVKSELSQMPSFAEEQAKLGDYAEQRIDRVNRWLDRHLSEGSKATVDRLAVTADVISLVEEVMELTGEPAFEMTDSGNTKDVLSRNDLFEMMKDKRYSGMSHEQDQAFITRVRNGFARLAKLENRTR